MTRNVAALRFSKIAVFDSLEALGLRSQDWVLGFVNVAVDHRGKERILFVFKSARTVKLSLALVDSGIGSLFAIECLGLAVNDRAAFLNDDLGNEGFRAVFSSPSNYRAHLVALLPVGVVDRSCHRLPVRLKPEKYDNVVPPMEKWVQNRPKMVRHQQALDRRK